MSLSKSQDVCYFAKTNFRNEAKAFGIRQKDRLHHFYILGRTGTGKSNLIATKIIQDMQCGRGVCLMDVHNDLVKKIYVQVPKHRKEDLIYLDATNTELNWGYNPLRKVSYELRPLVASNILEIFQNLWGTQSWGIKLAHILRNILLLLLDQPYADFSHILKVLQNNEFRNQCLQNVVNPEVKNFFEKEFKSYTKNDLLPIYNKLGGLLSYPSVKRILVSNKKQISLRKIMDNQQILLVNISKGNLGSEASYILGALLLNSLSSAAFSRVTLSEEERLPFFCFLDEFQNYTTGNLVSTMLSELRKFKIGFVMAHQYISQLDTKVRDAVLGNVGTMVTFRLSQQDAKYMQREFAPVFEVADFVNLPNYDIYLKLMIDGTPSVSFSATTLSVMQFSDATSLKKIG